MPSDGGDDPKEESVEKVEVGRVHTSLNELGRPPTRPPRNCHASNCRLLAIMQLARASSEVTVTTLRSGASKGERFGLTQAEDSQQGN